jgi:hypothetical protein
VWVCGRVGVWVCGCVGVWVCGCVGGCVCVCMGMWVCGCMGVWFCGGRGVLVCKYRDRDELCGVVSRLEQRRLQLDDLHLLFRSSQFKNNHLTELCSGSKAGSY